MIANNIAVPVRLDEESDFSLRGRMEGLQHSLDRDRARVEEATKNNRAMTPEPERNFRHCQSPDMPVRKPINDRLARQQGRSRLLLPSKLLIALFFKPIALLLLQNLFARELFLLVSQHPLPLLEQLAKLTASVCTPKLTRPSDEHKGRKADSRPCNGGSCDAAACKQDLVGAVL